MLTPGLTSDDVQQPTKYSLLRRVGTFLLVFGASLFSQRLANTTLHPADIVYLIANFYGVVILRRIQYSHQFVLGAIWLCIALFGGYTLFLTDPWFNLPSFSDSLLRAGTSVALLATMPVWCRRVGYERFLSYLLWVVRIHAAIVIAHWLVLRMGFFANNLARPAGLFAEPAWFAWYAGLALFTIVQGEALWPKGRMAIADVILMVIATLVSTSVTAVIFVMAGLLAYAVQILQRRWQRVSLGRALAGIIVASMAVLPYVVFSVPREGAISITEYWVRRAERLVAGRDSSTTHRLPGSIEVASLIVSERPLTGTGLGNERRLIGSVASRLQSYESSFDPQDINIHIGFATAFANTGILGGTIYSALVISYLLRRDTFWFGVGLVLANFAWGGYTVGITWWFMGLVLGFKQGGKVGRIKANRARCLQSKGHWLDAKNRRGFTPAYLVITDA